ncbi:hypothetical protein [Microbispora sp. H10836]|uniref:hypothetical protein n=1 Tax=Microbispora sp. H10836 TaxID=2729106 RepID=UPI001472CA6E|nr:hypothetical protein [Microbispora sp. H10836]
MDDTYSAESRIGLPASRAPAAGVEVRPDVISVCKSTPTARERWLSGLAESPGFLLTLGVLVGLRILLAKMRRRGLRDASIPKFARRFGVFLIVGALLFPAAAQLGRMAFVGAVVTDGVAGAALTPDIWDHARFDLVGGIDYEIALLGLVIIWVSKILQYRMSETDDAVSRNDPGLEL